MIPRGRPGAGWPRAWALVAGLWVVVAYALKRHYAQASAAQLDWLLGPTASLVARVTGEAFPFEPGVGYVSRSLATAIVPGCAGVNFLIAALATLWLAIAARRPAQPWLSVCLSPLAYALTVVVNAGRILADIALRNLDSVEALGWDHASQHRALGVVVYLLSLVGSYAVVRGGRAKTRWLPPWLLPVCAYAAIALLVPWLNGAAANPAFAGHVGAVLGWVALVVTLLEVARRLLRIGNRVGVRR